MDQSTTALSVFGWGRMERGGGPGVMRESISREEGCMKTQRVRRRRCVDHAGPSGVAPSAHFIIIFLNKGSCP